MLIKQASEKAIAAFEDCGIDTALLDARVLLQDAIGKDHSFIIAHSDYELSAEEQQRFEGYVKLRAERKPISHILGKKEFWGVDFVVSEHVLTPRPDTEVLIETALKHFKGQENLEILDLGTGSGCILLSLLKEFVGSNGIGVDLSKEALAIAQKNAYNLDVKNAKFVQSNWFENIDNLKRFDLIVSNPPYIPRDDFLQLAPELGFEPEMALTDGVDGLAHYRTIAAGLKSLDFKMCILEIGINQETEVKEIFKKESFKHVETARDLSGIARVVAFAK